MFAIVEQHDLRKLALGTEGMHFQLAKHCAQRNVLGGGEMLRAREDDLVLDQRRLQRAKRCGVQRLCQVQPVNLRAQMAPDPLNAERRAAQRLLRPRMRVHVYVHGDPPALLFRHHDAKPRAFPAQERF